MFMLFLYKDDLLLWRKVGWGDRGYSTIQETYEHCVQETIQNTMFIVRSQSFFEADSFS
jgi:hypothetical protein